MVQSYRSQELLQYIIRGCFTRRIHAQRTPYRYPKGTRRVAPTPSRLHRRLQAIMTISLHPCNPMSALNTNQVSVSWDRIRDAQLRAHAWIRELGVVDQLDSRWGLYLRSVYGNSGVQLPLDIRRLRWFWWWAPGTTNLTRIEAPVWRRLLPGDLWVPGMKIERHLSLGGFFIHPLEQNTDTLPAYTASSHTLEVMRVSHLATESSTKTAYGPEAAAPGQTWYWHAPGSGIFLRMGRSLVVPNRSSLLTELTSRDPTAVLLSASTVRVSQARGYNLCEGCGDQETWVDFEVIRLSSTQRSSSSRVFPADSPARAKTASSTPPLLLCDVIRRAGFDTVQLTAAFGGQRFEIIDCRHQDDVGNNERFLPTSACPSPSHSQLSNALQHAIARPDCGCDTNLPFLNCGTCVSSAAVTRIPQHSSEAFPIRAPKLGRRGT